MAEEYTSNQHDHEMSTSTKDILGQISVGCHMAIDSTEQIMEHVTNDRFKELIGKYRDDHEKLKAEVEQRLRNHGIEIPTSGVMAKAFSWMSAETKLMFNDTDREAAKLLMDGCNMGIQSISEYINDNPDACETCKQYAKRLVSLEEDFMQELKPYL